MSPRPGSGVRKFSIGVGGWTVAYGFVVWVGWWEVGAGYCVPLCFLGEFEAVVDGWDAPGVSELGEVG